MDGFSSGGLTANRLVVWCNVLAIVLFLVVVIPCLHGCIGVACDGVDGVARG